MDSSSDCEAESTPKAARKLVKSPSLRLHLARTLSPVRTKGFKNFSSPESSPGPGSPKTRFSWQSSLLCKDLRFKQAFSAPSSPVRATVWYDDEERMKYSPQQQQQEQKDRKSESEMSSVNATPCRVASALQRSASAASAGQSSSVARRALTTCRPLSTDMFAWMRVFRLATMLHQAGC